MESSETLSLRYRSGFSIGVPLRKLYIDITNKRKELKLTRIWSKKPRRDQIWDSWIEWVSVRFPAVKNYVIWRIRRRTGLPEFTWKLLPTNLSRALDESLRWLLRKRSNLWVETTLNDHSNQRETTNTRTPLNLTNILSERKKEE